MKLYYSPFACSLAAHIACREAGLQVTLQRIELASKRIEGAGDLRSLNPMGQVPTLITDHGRVLMENSAVLLYIADHARSGQLAPPHLSFARYELMRWLSFVASEVHKKCLWPIFAPGTPEPIKVHARELAALPLQVLERELAGRDCLLGADFSIADAYLWWALTIFPHAQVSLEPYPSLRAYQARHLERPAVSAAVSFERAQFKRAFQPDSTEVHAIP